MVQHLLSGDQAPTLDDSAWQAMPHFCEIGWPRIPGGRTLNVEVIGMLVGNFLENPKRYPKFDFKPLKNTEIAIFRAVLGLFWEKWL